jgi:hypothetical protein
VLLGYGLAAMSKPLFPFAGGTGLVLTARFADRLGKGIRGAPRDSLIADVTPIAQRGRRSVAGAYRASARRMAENRAWCPLE